MSPLPVRIRLTAWYSLLLAAAMLSLGVLAIILMRRSINETVDEQLKAEATALQQLVASSDPGELPGKIATHAERQAAIFLLQVTDISGDVLYRSPAISALNLSSIRSPGQRFATLHTDAGPYRVYSIHLGGRDQGLQAQIASDMDDFAEATARYEILLAICIPLLLVAAALGGYGMSGLALNPVLAITNSARNIDPRDLTARVESPHTNDELQVLADTVNAMLQRLEDAFRRISQFTMDASHELRTPVALVRTRAEVALRKPRSEEAYREVLREILGESERISGLIENLMLLARTDTGLETMRFLRTDLRVIIARICSEAQMLADARHLAWSQSLPGGPVWVSADEEALPRVLLILIDNALKYTPTPGSIQVSLLTDTTDAYIEVRDSGIGISEQDLPHIFERFYRAQASRSAGYEGAGLGLSIGQWLAQAHRGEITASSELNQGSRFRLRLPLEGQSPPETSGRETSPSL